MAGHVQQCPECSSGDIRWLSHLSQSCWVDYYRCVTCGHVWTLPKPGDSTEPRSDRA